MAKTDKEYNDLLVEKDAAVAATILADEKVAYQDDRSTRIDAIVIRLLAALPKYNVVDDQGIDRAAVLHNDLMAAVYDPVMGLDTIPAKL